MSSPTTLLGGKWRVEDDLGAGGMGKVVKATYASSGYPCAIKFMLPEHRTNEEFVARFINEAQISNRIGHPGVCRVIDVGWTDDELPFLVMEYLEGQSIYELLAKEPGLATIGEALEVTRRVLEVLAAAHVHGIFHRDIKPDNIFVTRDGSIKVLDFGIARLPGAGLTRVGATLGTAGYMPPEVAHRDALATGPTSDVWSLGATAFQLLTGQTPLDFSACTSLQQMIDVTATTPARSLGSVLPRCPTRLVEVVDRMLAFSPGDRFTAEQALAALDEVVIPPALVGQVAPWVWDPRLAARPRGSSIGLYRRAEVTAELFESAQAPGEPDPRDAEAEAERDQANEDELRRLHDRIQREPQSYDDHHRLVRLYLELGERESAISIARTLRFLEREDRLERELAEEVDGVFELPRGRVSRKQWREALMFAHPSAPLSAVLARLWPVLAFRRRQSYDEMKLGDYPRESVGDDATGIARWLAHMAGVLDMEPPELRVRDHPAGGFEIAVPSDATAAQPTLIADETVMMPQPPVARAFRCGHALARAHPYLIAAAILPSSTRLRDAIHGATALTSPGVWIPPAHADKAEIWKQLIADRLPPERIDALRRAVERVVRLGGDSKAWLRGCQHTAVRVGLLMAGDIDVAVEIVRGGTVRIAIDPEELVRELVAFSVSRKYLQLRRSLERA